MIHFEVKKGKYFVSWADQDGYQKLYLILMPEGKIKYIEENTLSIGTENAVGKLIEPIPIYHTGHPAALDLPTLPYGKYICGLYEDKSGEGKPLRQISYYNRGNWKMTVRQRQRKEEVSELILECRYRIPKDLFWLQFSEFGIGRYYLPPMRAGVGQGYSTSCMILSKACNWIEVCLSDDIKDYVDVEYLSDGEEKDGMYLSKLRKKRQ